MKTTHTIQHNGQGPLTVEKLADLADTITSQAPPTAKVIIHSGQDQRDHDEFWNIHVTWETQ